MPANSRWDLIQRLKGLKLLKKNPGNGRLNNLNDPRPQCVKKTEGIDAFCVQ